MDVDNHKLNELKKIIDSYTSLSELTEKLQADYREMSEKFESQSQQLEHTNLQLSEALLINNKLSTYLNNTLEYLNAGVVVFEIDGRISLFNQAAERLTGVSRDRALDQNYKEIFPGDEHDPTFKLMAGTEDKVHGEKWYGDQPVGYSSNRIYDDDGTISGVVEIIYDISAEKKLRETIRNVSAFASVGEMAERIAHQVRNPLAGIIGFSDLLQRDLSPDHPSINIAKNISKGAKELNNIITSLLNFIKKTEPEFRELDLVKFIKDTIVFLENESFTEKIKFHFRSSNDLLIYRFDPILFRQVFINITQNAWQAMRPDGGTITIDIRKSSQNSIRIIFSDTGKGILSEDSDKIFNPFYTTWADGIGLGLPIVKKVIDYHNGAITANNNEGGGAVIIIELPL